MKEYDALTERKQLFIDGCLRGESVNDAYSNAGYVVEGRSWSRNARALHKELSPIIRKMVMDSISADALVAKRIVIDIMNDESVNPAIRLKAAEGVMSRAGWDSPRVLEINDLRDATDDELTNEITALLNQAGELLEKNSGLDAKPVTH